MSSISIPVAHAVRFLTAKLASSYSPAAIRTLNAALERNLTSHCAPTWNSPDLIVASAARCLTLSPTRLPPTPIWEACASAAVQWFDWISLLGNKEFDLFIDPGSVTVRCDTQIATVWSDDEPLPRPAYPNSRLPGKAIHHQDDITPSWITPILTQFPIPRRSTSPLSSVSEHSRCSSRSSNSSSSTFSLASADTASSRTSADSASSKSDSPVHKQSRRERARQARVFVDTSKIDVTPYDGGKTTVLTGGVMLGGGNKPSPANKLVASNTNSNSWRTARA